MKNIEYYEKLPDVVHQTEVENALNSIFRESQSQGSEETLAVIYELSLRQANNYKYISRDLHTKVNDYVIKNLNFSCEYNVETSIGIIVNLGLQNAYYYIKSSASSVNHLAVKKLLEETIDEFGDSIPNVDHLGAE